MVDRCRRSVWSGFRFTRGGFLSELIQRGSISLLQPFWRLHWGQFNQLGAGVIWRRLYSGYGRKLVCFRTCKLFQLRDCCCTYISSRCGPRRYVMVLCGTNSDHYQIYLQGNHRSIFRPWHDRWHLHCQPIHAGLRECRERYRSHNDRLSATPHYVLLWHGDWPALQVGNLHRRYRPGNKSVWRCVFVVDVE